MKRQAQTEFVSSKRGGVRQRAARANEMQQSAKVCSFLAEHLLMMWAWGLMSTPAVQKIAYRLKQDIALAVAGNLDMTSVDMLAGIGADGHVARDG